MGAQLYERPFSTTMNIADILSPDCTFCSAKLSSKKKVLETLSEMLAGCSDEVSKEDILCSLLARERLGSTGVGNGIAIPHGRLQLDKVHAAVVTTESPIAFDAIDNKPVDVFFAIIVPEQDCQQHIKVLSAIAQNLSDKKQVKSIRNADTNDSLYAKLIAA